MAKKTQWSLAVAMN